MAHVLLDLIAEAVCGTETTCAAWAQSVVHVRPTEQTYPTEFGHIKVQAGHIEKPATGEHRFVAKPETTVTEHAYIKEE